MRLIKPSGVHAKMVCSLVHMRCMASSEGEHLLAGVSRNVLEEYGGAVLAACKQLLEAESTSVHLVAPLLGVVTQAGSAVP